MRPPRAWIIMTRISPADATIGFAVVPDARAHDLAHGLRAAPRKSESRKKPYRVLCLVILLMSLCLLSCILYIQSRIVSLRVTLTAITCDVGRVWTSLAV